MSNGVSGSCLCGSVRYDTAAPPQLVAHCHCVDCRKSSGTGHSTHLVFPEADVRVSGEVRFYDHPADSGNIVSRGFCPNCGSPVMSRNSGLPGMVFPRASILDDINSITPGMVVYHSRAAHWDVTDSELPKFDTVPEGGPKRVIENL